MIRLLRQEWDWIFHSDELSSERFWRWLRHGWHWLRR